MTTAEAHDHNEPLYTYGPAAGTIGDLADRLGPGGSTVINGWLITRLPDPTERARDDR